MKTMKWLGILLILIATCASGVFAQVSTINSVKLFQREFNDDPTSVLTTVNNYPSLVSFDDQSVNGDGAGSEFANRHVWRFSNDGGANAFKFTNDSFFSVFMDVTLTGTASPRKEAGFLFDTLGGQGQFFVNTDAHEVVAFGGPLPFYAFASTFDSGETIRLGMDYFLDTDGKRKIIYYANGVASPAQEFTNLEQGIINNSTLGGYLQVQIAPNNPNNFATAEFRNIRIQAIPEPSSLLLCGVGLAALAFSPLRRRS